MTTTAPTVAAPLITGPEVVLFGRTVPVVLPKLSDPRLKLSTTILTLTVLGLTILNFQVSVPQILVSVVLCAAIDMAMAYRKDGVLIWPASGLQTGVSVAFIFRAGGTVHGDWWSVRGLHLFVLVALVCMLSKYTLRLHGRHVFNPSNIGLAWGLLVIGPSYAFSEHLWWAPLGPAVLLAMSVILAGAWWVLRQVKMIPMAVTFMAVFCVLIGIFALSGHSYYATWHEGPVSGAFYWITVALSPELLIFVFFMISDPQTSPKSPTGRKLYAVTVAVIAAALISVQTTEFGIKLAILASLVATCPLVPLFEKASARIESHRAGLPGQPWFSQPPGVSLRSAVRNRVVVAVVVIAVAAPLNTALLPQDDSILLIEQKLTGRTVQ